MTYPRRLRIPKKRLHKLCAATLAAGMLLSVVSPTALAVDYYTADGTVYVEATDDGGVLSWQNETNKSDDTVINIFGNESADEPNNSTEGTEYSSESSEANANSNENSENNEDGTAVSDENENTNVNENTDANESSDATDDEPAVQLNETNETESSSGTLENGQIVKVGNDVKGVTININGVAVEGNTDAAIEIGENTDIDLNIKETIIQNAQDDGIYVGANSNVDITFEGDNYFSGVGKDANASGIQTTGSGTNDSSSVTIKGKTDEEGDGATFTVENASNGIYIGRNDSVTIDGGNPDGEGNLDIVINDTIGTQNADSTTSGIGILNYGDLTIKDGASVEINGSQSGGAKNAGYGIGTNVTSANNEGSGSLSIKGSGTSVSIKDTEASGILVESYDGDHAGELLIDGATVEISQSGSHAIGLDSSNATITGGANVHLDSAAGHTINMGIIVESENFLDITGEGTTVLIKNGGRNGINVSNNKTLNILDGSKVEIENTKSDAIWIWRDGTVTVEDAELLAPTKSIMLYNTNPEEGMARMVILNDSKVVVSDVYRYNGPASLRVELIVQGGTLELTKVGTNRTSGLTNSYYQTLPSSVVNDGNTFIVWPTNGEEYGNEKLVNFQLPADEAHALFATFGWKDGQFIPYDGGYSCDLSKYDDGDMLSVWVPAVVLEYYYKDKLPKGTSFDDLSEEQILELLENTLYNGQEDAIIRGQSIAFATLNKDYTSGNTGVSDIEWYYFDQNGNLQHFDANTEIIAKELKNIYGLDVVKEPSNDTPGTTPVDPEPSIPIEEISTTTPETPAASSVTITDEAVPQTTIADEAVPQTTIADEATPLASLPQTGQNWAMAGLLGAVGALLTSAGFASGKHSKSKRRKDEYEA